MVHHVDHLGNKTSTDCNNISMVIIKKCIDSIIKPFTYICNKSFESGIIPDSMKMAKVIRAFKTGDKSQYNSWAQIIYCLC